MTKPADIGGKRLISLAPNFSKVFHTQSIGKGESLQLSPKIDDLCTSLWLKLNAWEEYQWKEVNPNNIQLQKTRENIKTIAFQLREFREQLDRLK